LISALVLGRAFYIQQVQGRYWKGLSDSLHQKYVALSAERGTVYSDDGSMLSTSVPYFNIYIDFGADGLVEKNGKRFRENLDSLSGCLARLFKDQSGASYRRDLMQGFRLHDRYFPLQKNLTFEQYRELRKFPLVRQGRNKSGFITEINNKRLNPFGLLANRTIGLARANAQNVGLERTYDSLLKGENGSRLVRYIAGGAYVPVEGYEIEPENGKDIHTTLDVNIQDIAENALLSMLMENECEYGTCIVMDVATGQIKAIANLGRQKDGSYWEDLNYAIRASEPGSTFKLATLISMLDDKDVRLTDHVNLEGGVWKVGRRTVRDAEKHEGESEVTVKKAFELSSNVGMAKLALHSYERNPGEFIDHLKKFHFNQITGIDLAGETQPIVKSPKSKTWSATTLPWMAFGYEVLISPLQTLTLYNAIANNGKMMRPYLVNDIEVAGRIEKQNRPAAISESICSSQTLAEVKECLEGVCIEGTAKNVFRNSFYRVAGKTGTALVANGSRGYADHIYQSSFAGYFPAEQPKYSCIVVIKNKPFAKKFLGASVAAPVFREVADKLMSMETNNPVAGEAVLRSILVNKDSIQVSYAGNCRNLKQVIRGVSWDCSDSAGTAGYAHISMADFHPVMRGKFVELRSMPDLKGLGLQDALSILEEMNMKRISVRGMGKVRTQNIEPGTAYSKNQNVVLELN
jgi:cell division protein FtsI (penicillin-binding protein 3)